MHYIHQVKKDSKSKISNINENLKKRKKEKY